MQFAVGVAAYRRLLAVTENDRANSQGCVFEINLEKALASG
ncbi:hypothetical protein [Acetobacter sp. DsW_063]|nr:hypothetical protein [Acetobacter sp. DsW_063]